MTQTFAFLLLPGFSMMGLMSAIEPLRVANRFRPGAYRWQLLSVDGAAVSASFWRAASVRACPSDNRCAQATAIRPVLIQRCVTSGGKARRRSSSMARKPESS